MGERSGRSWLRWGVGGASVRAYQTDHKAVGADTPGRASGHADQCDGFLDIVSYSGKGHDGVAWDRFRGAVVRQPSILKQPHGPAFGPAG